MLTRLVLCLFLCLGLGLGVPGAYAQDVEVALFEGGEGLTYFRQCALELGQVNLYGDPRISEKLRIRILEGKPPEVSNANLPYEQLIAKGHILDLQPWLNGPNWEGTGPWRDDFLPGSLERYAQNGKTYALPVQYVVQAVYYNQRLFRERGWETPHTWSQWTRLCQQIQDSGLPPLAFQGRYTYYASPLIQHAYYHLAGPQAYREQLQLKPGSFDNPAMIEALTLVQQLAKKYFQPGSLGMSHSEAQVEFLQGRAAMLVCGSWFKSEMRDKIPPDFELGQFAIPAPTSSPTRAGKAVQVGAGYFFVFSHSAQPARGVDYLRFITSRNKIRQLVQAQDLPVAVVGANRYLSKDLAQLARMLEQATTSFGEGMTSTDPGMVQVWSDIRFDLLHERATPAQLAQRLESAAQRLRQQSANPGAIAWLFPGRAMLLLGSLLALLLWGARKPQYQRGQALRTLTQSDLLLLAAPPLLVYSLFFLVPSLLALLAAGFQWDGLGPATWVGFHNFGQLLLASPTFWQALANNLFLMACIPAAVTLWSLFFAVLLQPNQAPQRALRALFFFPHLMGIGSILVWQQLYHPQGPLNQWLTSLGFSGFANFTWLSQDHLYPSLLPLALWSASGFQLVLTCAALTQVPQELYEAAHLEGANGWQKFWAVSWPYLKPTVWAGYFLLVISAVKSFESIWLLTNQEPTSQVHVLGTLLMQTAFAELRLGEATAIAVILLGLVLALQAALGRSSPEQM